MSLISLFFFFGPWEPCGSGHQEFLHSLCMVALAGLWGLCPVVKPWSLIPFNYRMSIHLLWEDRGTSHFLVPRYIILLSLLLDMILVSWSHVLVTGWCEYLCCPHARVDISCLGNTNCLEPRQRSKVFEYCLLRSINIYWLWLVDTGIYLGLLLNCLTFRYILLNSTIYICSIDIYIQFLFSYSPYAIPFSTLILNQ